MIKTKTSLLCIISQEYSKIILNIFINQKYRNLSANISGVFYFYFISFHFETPATPFLFEWE